MLPSLLFTDPPQKTNLTMKQVVKENEFFSITCTVVSSPQAELTLSRSSLTNPERDIILLQKIQANFLSFNLKASVSDGGVYNCSAKNSEGQSSSNNHLKVLCKKNYLHLLYLVQ